MSNAACNTQVIVLDPLNRTLIDKVRALLWSSSTFLPLLVVYRAWTQHGLQAIADGVKCFVGGNCTTVVLITLTALYFIDCGASRRGVIYRWRSQCHRPPNSLPRAPC